MKSIVVIDSGIGGLTLLNSILKNSNSLDISYICDSKNVPYGEKNNEFIHQRIDLMFENLDVEKLDLAVIACNTLTASSIDYLRSRFDFPIVGIEPYLNFPKKLNLKPEDCCLIATKSTLDSLRFKRLQTELDPDKRISTVKLPRLALLLEKLRDHDFAEIKDLIDQELKVLNDISFKYLILGCTHYPIISKYLHLKFEAEIIDPSKYVVKQIFQVLNLNTDKNLSNNHFNLSEDCGQTWDKIDIDNLSFLKYL